MHRKGSGITILPNGRLHNGTDSLSPHVPTVREFTFTLFPFTDVQLLYNAVLVLLFIVICVHMPPPSGASLPPILTPVLWAITEHQAQLPVPGGSFPLAVWHMAVYVCQWYSPICPLQISISWHAKSAGLRATVLCWGGWTRWSSLIQQLRWFLKWEHITWKSDCPFPSSNSG